ncbi:MAG: AbrB/MazE/SpoVT family DNA-binding domain-containing protein [Thermoprotei archaeon]|nr:MAG: AbrB/MazE/SpoVT family DNA-binding domain-containing protein [Thermoprotei archaeon]RLF24478.1 MAG: AbrB/MazE/SpoVT family DNA-binding domain-containing protein [Thermoprotei archaeon]
MTLRLKVGRKGYIIIPKPIREAMGISEGDEVAVEICEDGILLKPVRRVSLEELKKSLKEHVKRLEVLKERIEPKPGELASIPLEEEFES